VKNDDSRPERGRQHPSDPLPVGKSLIKGVQQRRRTTVEDISPANPAACQPPPPAARDPPPLPTTPGGHHTAFNALWLQEKGVLLGVVVAAHGYPRGGHPDNAMDDRLISLRQPKKSHIAHA
jgi:hypothetical protein